MKQHPKTWLITGCSQGIGLELTRMLLEAGHNVIATARSLDALRQAAGTPSDHFLPVQVDLTDEASVGQAVAAGLAQFGAIDVLVNNAGYGLIGGLEETSDAEVRASFDVNVFGLLNVTRAVLPHMRAAGAGYVVNLSSVFGLIAGGGWGVYCATKFAVEGASEALAQEVSPFGIRVTIVEPGYVRTNFLASGSIAVPEAPIAAYTAIAEEKRKHREDIPGTQLGDPKKVAAAIIAVSETAEPPLRLLLGSDALQFATYKLNMLHANFEATRDLTLSTDFR